MDAPLPNPSSPAPPDAKLHGAASHVAREISEAPLLLLVPEPLAMLVSEIDREGAGELVRMFVDDLPTQLGLCRDAFAAGDLKTLERLAHSLKGAAGSLGAVHLTEKARALEHASARGDTAACEVGCRGLSASAEVTAPVLQAWLSAAD